jgi:hypothetical protein
MDIKASDKPVIMVLIKLMPIHSDDWWRWFNDRKTPRHNTLKSGSPLDGRVGENALFISATNKENLKN